MTNSFLLDKNGGNINMYLPQLKLPTAILVTSLIGLSGFLIYTVGDIFSHSSVITVNQSPASQTPSASHHRLPLGKAENRIRSISVPFIENSGQLDARVAFYTPIAGGKVFVTHDRQIVYDLHKAMKPVMRKTGKPSNNIQRFSHNDEKRWTLTESFGGNGTSTPRGVEPTATHVSSFLGNDASRWRKGSPTYQSVQIDDVYPGVSLKLLAHGNSVEKLYTVTPAGVPSVIRMQLEGANCITVDDAQALAIDTGLGAVTFSRPVAWQEHDGKRDDVPVTWQLFEDGSYGFKVAAYDTAQNLYIDPLIQATYLGGSGDDSLGIADIAANGNLYLTGGTSSTDFPGTSGGAQTNNGGGGDGVAAILSPDLTTLIQVTYLGGSGDEAAGRAFRILCQLNIQHAV